MRPYRGFLETIQEVIDTIQGGYNKTRRFELRGVTWPAESDRPHQWRMMVMGVLSRGSKM